MSFSMFSFLAIQVTRNENINKNNYGKTLQSLILSYQEGELHNEETIVFSFNTIVSSM